MKSIFAFLSLVITSTVFGQIVRPADDLFRLNSQLNAGKTGAQIMKESDSNLARFVALDVNATAHPNISRNDDTRGKPTSLTLENAKAVLKTAFLFIGFRMIDNFIFFVLIEDINLSSRLMDFC